MILLFHTQFLFSQDIYQFTEGLMLKSELAYSREAIVEDEIAYQIFQNKTIDPKAGDLFEFSNGQSTWKEVAADSSGEFRGEDLSQGYLYLSYESDAEKTVLLNLAGHNMLFFNGVPHAGDIYKSGWMYIPVTLRKGRNDLFVRCSRWARWQGINAKMVFPEKLITLKTEDLTLPFIVIGENQNELTGAVVVMNASQKRLEGLSITTKLEGKEITKELSDILPMSLRKSPFVFDASSVTEKGKYTCTLQLKSKGKLLDEKQIEMEAVNPDQHYSVTFTSDIDGSVQYYGVTPQIGGTREGSSLFLSVHGAGVEAIGQARAYDPKDWGVLVAPTNRRPRGFNWEDWGRLDALEVLEIAKRKFKPDPQRIYLTGHSMGGHGTWYLGATYPGKWAAIAPCAGYPTLRVYGSSDGKIPEKGISEVEDILLQASSPSDVLQMSHNYKASGVYIFHGDSDKVVSVDYARQMRKLFADFHQDFSYYEYPGGSHWFGDESVDWPPLFEYFKWHSIPQDSLVNQVDFTTPSPAISSQYRWAHVLQQQKSFRFSRLKLTRSVSGKSFRGTTENIAILGFSLASFQPGDEIQIELDNSSPITYTVQRTGDMIYLHNKADWLLGEKPDKNLKGVVRGGSFRAPFNHRMVFVYGTLGNSKEDKLNFEKARYDAEAWYYRGNGAVDILSDKMFDPGNFPDRGVILYGNAANNSAWEKLIADCPIQVNRGSVTVGDQKYTGDDLGAYFMWPRPDSEIASVAVISGSGEVGMKATEANQYFAAGSGFPDFMIFSVEMLREGAKGIKSAGFYTNDWKIDPENSVIKP